MRLLIRTWTWYLASCSLGELVGLWRSRRQREGRGKYKILDSPTRHDRRHSPSEEGRRLSQPHRTSAPPLTSTASDHPPPSHRLRGRRRRRTLAWGRMFPGERPTRGAMQAAVYCCPCSSSLRRVGAATSPLATSASPSPYKSQCTRQYVSIDRTGTATHPCRLLLKSAEHCSKTSPLISISNLRALKARLWI